MTNLLISSEKYITMIFPAARLLALVVALFLNFYATVPAYAQADELQDANQLFKQGQLDRASTASMRISRRIQRMRADGS